MLPPVQLIPPNFQNNRNSEQGGYRQTACTCEFSFENSSFTVRSRARLAARRGQTGCLYLRVFSRKIVFLLCALAHALRQGGYRLFVPVPASFLLKTRFFTVRSRARLAARMVQTLRACTCEFSLENSSFYCALSRTPCGKDRRGSGAVHWSERTK